MPGSQERPPERQGKGTEPYSASIPLSPNQLGDLYKNLVSFNDQYPIVPFNFNSNVQMYKSQGWSLSTTSHYATANVIARYQNATGAYTVSSDHKC